MTLPKSWNEILAERYNRAVKTSRLVWGGTETSQIVQVPVIYGKALIAIDNQCDQALTATLQTLLRIDDAQGAAVLTCQGGEDPETITITAVEAGVGLDIPKDVVIQVPEDPLSPLSASVEEDETGQTIIVISLATNDQGALDDTENTAENIVALFANGGEGEGEEELITIATAVYSDAGAGVFQAEDGASYEFEGAEVERWASVYGSDGNELELAIPTTERHQFGPYDYWPRFLEGRITLTAGTEPTDQGVTTVQIREV